MGDKGGRECRRPKRGEADEQGAVNARSSSGYGAKCGCASNPLTAEKLKDVALLPVRDNVPKASPLTNQRWNSVKFRPSSPLPWERKCCHNRITISCSKCGSKVPSTRMKSDRVMMRPETPVPPALQKRLKSWSGLCRDLLTALRTRFITLKTLSVPSPSISGIGVTPPLRLKGEASNS